MEPLPDLYSISGIDLCILRLDTYQTITYCNQVFLRQFSLRLDDVIGCPLRELRHGLPVDLFQYLKNVHEDSVTNVKDEKGKVWRVSISCDEEGRNVVIEDITEYEGLRSYVDRYVMGGFEDLSEEDRATFKYPERRFMSVSFSDLRGFTAMSEKMRPEEVRATMNDYLESVIRAVERNHATVDKIVGDELMALYGAPRYFKDHALRAVLTACDQIELLAKTQKDYEANGKQMPGCGIGVNTGDMVLGNMGSTSRQDYTVLGAAVNLAARLCGAAQSGQVLTTEITLNAVLENLPEGWESCGYYSGYEYPIETLGGKTESVLPLDEDYKGYVVAIGPQVSQNFESVELLFEYLYKVKVKGVGEPVPVIAVKRNEAETRQNRNTILSQETTSPENVERIFGKYRLIEVIGRGGMGEVWKARDAFGNIVAIKTLLAGEGASEGAIKRLKREAEVMRNLQHRNICRIHEIGEFEKVTYIAMEYVEGVPLSKLLKMEQSGTVSSLFSVKNVDIRTLIAEASQAPAEIVDEQGAAEVVKNKRYAILPLTQTLAIVKQVCQAITFAHSRGILHRDLKPDNIIIRPDGEPVVMDFGLAKMETDTTGGASMTVSGQIMGTVEYMSPEQASGSAQVNEATDIYSIGAILYQMVSGARHFESSGNILLDANTLQTHRPVSPKKHNSLVDADLEVICLKALQPEVTDRYRSTQIVFEDIESFERGEPISARAISPVGLFWKWVKRNRMLSGTVAAFLIIGFVSTVSFIYFLNQQRVEAFLAKEKAQLAQAEAEERRKEVEESLAKLQRAMDEIRRKDSTIAEYFEKNEVASQAINQLKEQKESILQEQLKQQEEDRKRAISALEQAETDYQAGNFRQALIEVQKALLILPESSEAHWIAARIRFVELDMESAKLHLEKLKDLDPAWKEKVEALNALISTYGDSLFYDGRRISGAVLEQLMEKMQEPDRTLMANAHPLVEYYRDEYAHNRSAQAFDKIKAIAVNGKPEDARIATRVLVTGFSDLGIREQMQMILDEQLYPIIQDAVSWQQLSNEPFNLFTLIKNGSYAVNTRATQEAQRLVNEGGFSKLESLMSYLEPGDGEILNQLFVPLGLKAGRGDFMTLDRLMEYSGGTNQNMRSAATQALGIAYNGELKDAVSLALISKTSSDNPQERQEALRALALAASGVYLKNTANMSEAFNSLATFANSGNQALAQQAIQELQWLANNFQHQQAIQYLRER